MLARGVSSGPDEDLEKLRRLQSGILDDYARLVKPGGRLVYATCSVLTSENEERIEEFLKNHPDFERRGQPLKTRPDVDGQRIGRSIG